MTRKPAVLITGANGEIGHGLITALAAEGDRPIVTIDLSPLELLPPEPPSSYREYAQNAATHELPSIEYWLACFASADLIVTDSFHGCVFSILFNRPFIVYANEKRGASRFTSLLEVFGLNHHFVAESLDAVDERVFAPDWTAVNAVLRAERARAIAYLKENL